MPRLQPRLPPISSTLVCNWEQADTSAKPREAISSPIQDSTEKYRSAISRIHAGRYAAFFSTFGLSGNTADISEVLPDNASYSFSSQVYELSARAEFNFLPYGMGETYKRLRRWSPYLTLGVGVAMASSGGNTTVVPSIPMGVGVKFKINPRWNLGLEFTMTKAFGDKIDGSQLTDLNQIKTAFYKNTDWYSRLTIGISYEFGKRCETCHYVD